MFRRLQKLGTACAWSRVPSGIIKKNCHLKELKGLHAIIRIAKVTEIYIIDMINKIIDNETHSLSSNHGIT